MAGLRLLDLTGADVVPGQLHNLFPACRVGDAASVAYIQVLNASGSTAANLRAYLRLDAGGVACSIAMADSTARAEGYAYPAPTVPTTWVTPTTYAAGLALPVSLATATKVLLAVKRDPTTGAAASPETNVLIVAQS